MRLLLTATILAVLLPAPGYSSNQRFEYSEMAMGVRARIVMYAPDEAHAQDAARAAFERIAYLEQVMSDYRPDSELMRLCANAGGPPVRVSPELYYILRKANDLSRRSDGAFDVTIGPLIRLWRAARKSGKLPSQEEIDAARKLVGWRNVVIHPKTRTVILECDGSTSLSEAWLDTPGADGRQAARDQSDVQPSRAKMQLDLGGIAKGYACEEAIRVLKRHGISSALVEMGGDIVVSAPPPGKQGWEVALSGNPKSAIPSPHSELMLLSNCAVSSSGDTEQFVEIGGKRYSHIVDPKTGLGLTDRIAVTIIAPTGTLSDGLSTAVSVLGEEKGRALLRQYPRIKAFIRRAPD